MRIITPISLLSILLSSAKAATITYDFDISWLRANPDGLLERSVIGINKQWPIPTIRASVGDRVVVNVVNSLGNQSTSLHFHGLYMNGSTHMDGPVGVSQCGIPPGSSFTYDFKVSQPGTYWYHSHNKGQYPDGLRGALIVEDPKAPFSGQYDQEIVLTLSDWYHDQAQSLLRSFISPTNPRGTEPVPKSALMNDTQGLMVPVLPGKTYLFRIINMAAFASQYLWLEGHDMRIVEVDGIYTESTPASMLYVTPAQRYSVLVTMKNDTSSNYAFVGSMDEALFDQVPATLNPNVTGWLVYDSLKPLPEPVLVADFAPLDDFTLVPHDGLPLYDTVDYSMTLNFDMGNLGDGANYAFFNGVSYASPVVPTLYTALSAGANASSPAIYGGHTNSFVLEKDQVIEIIVNSNDPGKHPFHLHGHAFQAVVRGDDDAGAYVINSTLPSVPMRRDTLLIRPRSHAVLRFRADNPGVWLFHCHIEWHISTGLVATLIESPLTLQATLSPPASHLKLCADQGIPVRGNAAGNEVDWFDLTGENRAPLPLPEGFTARGIVALVFSCLSAFLGVAAIAWYGYGDIGIGESSAVK